MDTKHGIAPIGYFDNSNDDLAALFASNMMPTQAAHNSYDAISHPNLIHGFSNYLTIAAPFIEPAFYTGEITQVYRDSSQGGGIPSYPQGSEVDANSYAGIAQLQNILLGIP